MAEYIDESEVLQRALDTYGSRAQVVMVFEEMSELQKELCKYLRGKYSQANIAEEIADVEIMLEQMKMLFCCTDDVRDVRRRKVERLKARLDNVEPEYIEREAAMRAARHAWGEGLEPQQYIEIIPAADVAPVVHGHFVHDGPRFAGGGKSTRSTS